PFEVAAGTSIIGTHLAWLREKHGKPVFCNRQRSDVPDCVPLPVAEVTGAFGRYISSSVSWMLACAILSRPEAIGLWGVDMAMEGEYAYQKGSCEFFMGVALGAGIAVTIPKATDLLKSGGLY